MLIKLLGGRVTLGKNITPYTGQNDNWGFFQQRYGLDYRTRNKLKAYKNVVYGCTSLIGETVADYSPYLEKKVGKVWERVDHEFIDLLAQPAGKDAKTKPTSFSKYDLWEATAIYQVLQGDAFWYLARGETTGRPREIILLRADKVGTDIDKETGEVNGYFIRQAYGDPIPLDKEEVLRFPLFNPENPYKGKSVVEAGSDYIETDEGTAEFTKNFFHNGAGLSGVLNVKGEVTSGAFRKFVRAWREKYEGVGNAGKIAILRDSDASFEKIGLGLNELDMNALRKMSLADVCMMFKVPPELLGRITEGSGLGRGNIETLEYIFAKYNIDKKMRRFDSIIQFALLRYYDLTSDQYRVCHENIIPEDKEFELSERNQGVDRWMTRNEIRAEENAPDVDGGDQLFVPAMQLPLNETSTAAPPASGKGLKVKIMRHAAPSNPNDNPTVKVKTAKKKVKNSSITPAAAERFRITLMRNQMRYEKQYKRILAPVFRDQRAEALQNLEAHASAYEATDDIVLRAAQVAKAAQQKLFDDAAYDNIITSKLQPTLQDLSKTQGGLALVFAGDDNNEFHLTSNMISHLQRGTMKMATNFNDETLDKLNTTLAEGIQEGEAISKLKDRVNNVYDDIDSYRATRIARTETLKASNSASVEAYRQTGFVKSKVWVVNPDACPQCEEFDGKSVGLDDSFLELGASYTVTDADGNEETFTNSYDTVEEPPLHPNCRCTIIPSTE